MVWKLRHKLMRFLAQCHITPKIHVHICFIPGLIFFPPHWALPQVQWHDHMRVRGQECSGKLRWPPALVPMVPYAAKASLCRLKCQSPFLMPKNTITMKRNAIPVHVFKKSPFPSPGIMKRSHQKKCKEGVWSPTSGQGFSKTMCTEKRPCHNF